MEDPKDSVGVQTVAINWYRSLPWWPFCSRSVTIAWRFSHLILGAFSIYLIGLGWNVSAWIFGVKESAQWSGVSSVSLLDMGRELAGIAHRMSQQDGVRGMAAIVLDAFWVMLIGGFTGGLLARRSVLELGTQSASDWSSTIQLVSKRLPSLMWTLAMPWCAALLMVVPLFLLGLTAWLGSFGDFLANIGMILMIPLMMGAGWFALLGAIGFPLAIAGVVTEEHADAFDGFSRSAAYLYQKPVTFGIGVAMATAIGSIVASAIQFAMSMGRDVAFAGFRLSSGELTDASNGYGFAMADGWVQVLTLGFLYSFFWSAAAAIYLTLRNEVDHADFDDIDLNEKLPAKSVPEVGPSPLSQPNPALSGIHEQAE